MNRVSDEVELKVMNSITAIMATMMLWISPAFALSESDFYCIGSKYGVSPHLLKAIGIVESQDGKLTGKYEVSKVVNTTQLKFLKKIARYADRSLSDFKGSPKGAMGYMQIIPSTFYIYAQDGDGDGLKDPLNPYDSLATAAYFLARKIAAEPDLKVVLRKYNSSSAYTKKVLTLYWQLEAEKKIVDLLNSSHSRIP